jgi:hypothetical protein
MKCAKKLKLQDTSVHDLHPLHRASLQVAWLDLKIPQKHGGLGPPEYEWQTQTWIIPDIHTDIHNPKYHTLNDVPIFNTIVFA